MRLRGIHGLGVAGLILATSAACWPSVIALHHVWTDLGTRSYTHGYVVAAIAVYFLGRNLSEAGEWRGRPVWYAIALISLVSFCWVVAWKAAIQDLHLVLLPVLWLLSLVATYGWQVARLCVVPIGLFYFAMPFWGSINSVLQDITILAVAGLIWVTGLPAYVRGSLVDVPAGTFEIAGGCSGLHFFLVGLFVAVVYGELNRDPVPYRVAWIVLMGTLAVISNWLRVFVIVVAGYLTDMQSYLVTVDHYVFGWFVFAAAVAVFFKIVGRVNVPGVAVPQSAATSAINGERTGLAALLSVLAVVLLPVTTYAMTAAETRKVNLNVTWPQAPRLWSGPFVSDGVWQPYFVGASIEDMRSYVTPSGRTVDVYIAGYVTQSQGTELVYFRNSLAGAGEDARVRDEGRVVEVRGRTWREVEIGSDDTRRAVVWFEYWVGDRAVVDDLEVQLRYGLSLWHSPRAALVAIRASCQKDCAGAREILRVFASNTAFASPIAGDARENGGS